MAVGLHLRVEGFRGVGFRALHGFGSLGFWALGCGAWGRSFRVILGARVAAVAAGLHLLR